MLTLLYRFENNLVLGQYLGELVQAQDLLAVALPVATLVNHHLELCHQLVLRGRYHRQAPETGR